MIIDKDIKEVQRCDNIDEANQLIQLGWVLLETGSKIENDETAFFFLLGKPAVMELKERLKQEKEKKQKCCSI